jgi:hypothetical protein
MQTALEQMMKNTLAEKIALRQTPEPLGINDYP